MPDLSAKYRLASVGPLQRARVFETFRGQLCDLADAETDMWRLQEGSVLLFKPSATLGECYVEFQCQFHAVPGGGVDYSLLAQFLALCQRSTGKVKIVRSGSVVPANGGAVMSDVWSSRADAVARHIAKHPKDAKALERFCVDAPDTAVESNAPDRNSR